MLASRARRWTVAAVATFALVTTPVPAATSDELRVGVVDVQRVIEDAPRMKQYSEELEAFAQSLSSKLQLRAQNAMLSDEEIAELIDLKAKASPTSADTVRIKALTDAEKSRAGELTKLQQAKDLNDQQKASLKELQESRKKSAEISEATAKDYRGQLQKKGEDVRARAYSDMQAAISKVAEAKGLLLVLAKELPLPDGTMEPFVLHGGTDITDDVIGRLNRSSQ